MIIPGRIIQIDEMSSKVGFTITRSIAPNRLVLSADLQNITLQYFPWLNDFLLKVGTLHLDLHGRWHTADRMHCVSDDASVMLRVSSRVRAVSWRQSRLAWLGFLGVLTVSIVKLRGLDAC